MKPLEIERAEDRAKRKAALKAARETVRAMAPPPKRRKTKKRITPGWICVCGGFNDRTTGWAKVCASCGVPCPAQVSP